MLFLDEPTLGLDAQTRRLMWEYIKKLNKTGDVTIILTTHYMEEADFLSDRIAIIDHGVILASDTPYNLKNELGGDILTLEFENGINEMISETKKVPWIKLVKEFEDCNMCLSLSMEKADTRIPEVLQIANRLGAKVASVNIHKPSLEDVFLKYTGKTIRNIEEKERIF